MIVEGTSYEVKKGTLRVETEPSGAEIWVEGLRRGTSPLILENLTPGRVHIRAILSGYEEAGEWVEVKAGKEATVRLFPDKIKAKGMLEVKSDPDEAGLYVDGAYVGRTPYEMKDLKEGTYEVMVKKDGFDSWTQKVWVPAGDRTTVKADLSKISIEPEETGKLRALDPVLKKLLSSISYDPDKDPDGNQYLSLDKTTHYFTTNQYVGNILVVSGVVVNQYDHPRSHIRVKGILNSRAGGNLLGTKQVFGGNWLSKEEIQTLPYSEILERLRSESGQNNANLDIKPNETVKFMIVFDQIPDSLGSYTVEALGSDRSSQ